MPKSSTPIHLSLFPLQFDFLVSAPGSKHLAFLRTPLPQWYLRAASLLKLKKKKKKSFPVAQSPHPLAPRGPHSPSSFASYPAQALCDPLPQLPRLPYPRVSSLPPKFQALFLQLSRVLLPPSHKLRPEPILSESPRNPPPRAPTLAPAPARLPDQSTSLPCASSWESESPASSVEVAP